MTLSDFYRWLYRGQRPNWIARMANRATAALASSGIASNYLETLEVNGRKSGRVFSLPVAIAIVDGQRYLVSMLGENVQWVQNVRAAGGKAVLRSGRREPDPTCPSTKMRRSTNSRRSPQPSRSSVLPL